MARSSWAELTRVSGGGQFKFSSEYEPLVLTYWFVVRIPLRAFEMQLQRR